MQPDRTKNDTPSKPRPENEMWPAWMNIRTLGEYTNISSRTLESWKHGGHLPPHSPITARHHLWEKGGVDAWIDLKALGLFEDYKDLCERLGVNDAWAVMLERLAAAKAQTAAVVAQEVAQ